MEHHLGEEVVISCTALPFTGWAGRKLFTKYFISLMETSIEIHFFMFTKNLLFMSEKRSELI